MTRSYIRWGMAVRVARRAIVLTDRWTQENAGGLGALTGASPTALLFVTLFG